MQRTVDKIADIPVPRGGLQGTRPEQGSTEVCRDGGPRGGLQRLSQDRVQQRFAEMEDLVVVLQALFPITVQQRLVEQMMTMTPSGAPKSLLSIPAVLLGKMRKMRRRRRRRQRRWTLRSSPHASKAISGRGVIVCTSSRANAGGARRALSRTRTTSSTRLCRPCDHAAFSLKVPQIQFMIRVLDIPVVC